ncbi:MAG: hypothetical protein E7439_04185 [Ruminococcaceae bacterium]|nr:hypothetical protein [Oscillospiraceae bacterium]
MERIDPHTQQRVWQRVRGEQPDAIQEQPLIAAEAEIAAQLQTLIRYFPGNSRMLKAMLTQTRHHLACLRGMHLLRQGINLPKSTGIHRNSDPTALVRKCYVNCLNLCARYAALSNDPEYGIVYAEMAATTRHHCAQLLTLLGNGK